MIQRLYQNEPCWKALFLSVSNTIILDHTHTQSLPELMAQCMLNRLLRNYFSHVLGV